MTEAPQRPAGSARRAVHRGHAVRWAVGMGIGVMCAIGLVLLFMLTLATNNRVQYERHFAWLVGINVLVAGLLLAALAWGGVRLLLQVRRARFGTRLLIKLAGIFGLVGVVPGLLIYVVSYQFVSRSIESWFDVKVEGALSAGVSLGRATLDTLAADLVAKTRTASTQLVQVPDAAAGVVIERMRDQLGATDLVLWNANGQPVASTGQSRFSLSHERPAGQDFRAARQGRLTFQIEGLDDLRDPQAPENARVRLLVAVVHPGVGLLAEPRYVQATIPLPQTLVANAIAVQEANREYQERALARGGLRRMYIGTLTLALFLAVFGAVLLAVVLGNQLVRPLLVLAQGVREVAAGNLAPKAALQGQDELGGLTRDFALMTQQLADARSTAERSMSALDAARGNLQTIMDNLTAGVIVLDAQGRVQSSNPGATRILRAPLAAWEGRPLGEVPGLEAFATAVQGQFAAFAQDQSDRHGPDHWQHAFELHASGEGLDHQGTSLVMRGAQLPDSTRLLVFDDISELVSAQRAKAWGEVARRLAHEIKNPLTPIQLSAERLEMKLDGKLPPPEQAILAKSVRTIVEQVDAMKRLVNEFRDYARLPAAQLQPLDLNDLVRDILHLYEAENARVPVQAQLDPACPPIAGDPQQLRQVVHNLLQNALDATLHALQQAGSAPEAAVVHIATRWSEKAQRVRLVVADSGSGFPPHILQRAFEPYVTTKARGTGLGLAVVKKIADEHGARIELGNRLEGDVVKGAQVSLSFAPEPAVAR